MIHWFDIFVVVFLVTSIIWSYFRGLAKEVFSIASIVIGYLMASTYYDDAEPWVEWLISNKSTREIVAFTLLFFVTIILVALFGFFLRRILPLPRGLGAVNRIAGAGVGFIKGGVILSVIAFPLALIPGLQDDLIKESSAAVALVGISGVMLEKLAPNLAASINDSGYLKKRQTTAIEKARKQLDKIVKEVEEVKDKAVGATMKAGEFAEKTVDKIKDTTGKLKDKAVDVTSKITSKGEENRYPDSGITEADEKELDQLIEEREKN